MRYFLLTFLISTTACASTQPPPPPNLPTIVDLATPPKPINHGIDKEFAVLYAEYMLLATLHGVKFTGNAIVGFANIRIKEKHNREAIGLCGRGLGYREVSVDWKFWHRVNPQEKRILLFHELTHCLCRRDHDWGIGIEYPSADKDSLQDRFTMPVDLVKSRTPVNGYLPDECPMSIMYPRVVPDECSSGHKAFYDDEMFVRCVPY